MTDAKVPIFIIDPWIFFINYCDTFREAVVLGKASTSFCVVNCQYFALFFSSLALLQYFFIYILQFDHFYSFGIFSEYWK